MLQHHHVTSSRCDNSPAQRVLTLCPEVKCLRAKGRGMHRGATLHDAKGMVTQDAVGRSSSAQQKCILCLTTAQSWILTSLGQEYVFKLALPCVLHLSPAAIAARQVLVMYLLPDRLEPCWEYLQQMRLYGGTSFHCCPSSLQQSFVYD